MMSHKIKKEPIQVTPIETHKIGGLLLFFVCLFSVFATAVNANTITWYTSEYYPCHLVTGEKSNQGYCDLAIRDSIQYLSDYNHDIVPVTSQRALAVLKQDALGCALQFFKTPARQEFLYYSDPYVDVLPNGLIIWHQNTRFDKYINGYGKVSLTQVVNDRELIFGREKSRSYGKYIDDILDFHNITEIESAHDISYESMLKNGRVDYVIGYPYEKFGDELNIENANMRFLPINENPNLYQAHFACSKNPEGKAVIDLLNKKLAQGWKNTINGYYEGWLPSQVSSYYQKALEFLED